MSFSENDIEQESKTTWALGSYFEVARIIPSMSAHLIRSAKVKSADSVLDVACGSGNTAITARRIGAKVVGIDITPELLEKARQEASIAGVSNIDWREGDAENLPFEDNSFDVVLSSVGHMFTPRPDVVTKEIVRVTKPTGRISFTTWPPEHATGRIFEVIAKHAPASHDSPPSPMDWGVPNKIKEYFQDSVKHVHFERGYIKVPILSPNHYWLYMSTKFGPVIRVVNSLESTKLQDLRINFIKAIEPFIHDNLLKLDYLLTMMVKKD